MRRRTAELREPAPPRAGAAAVPLPPALPVEVAPDPPLDAPVCGALPPVGELLLGARPGSEGVFVPPVTRGALGSCGTVTDGVVTDGTVTDGTPTDGTVGVAARTGSSAFGGITVGTAGRLGALGSPRSAVAESALKSTIAATANTLTFIISFFRFPQ